MNKRKTVLKYAPLLLAFSLFSLVLTNMLNAQASINIDNYGVFFVQNGIVKEIRTEYEIGMVEFWEDYLILSGDGILGCCIYNTRTESISGWIWGDILRIENYDSLVVYVRDDRSSPRNEGCWMAAYASNTLEITEKTSIRCPYLPNRRRDNTFLFMEFERQLTTKEITGERSHRYTGENYYLDVNYGHNIDLTPYKYRDYMVNGGVENMFIILVQQIEYYKG